MRGFKGLVAFSAGVAGLAAVIIGFVAYSDLRARGLDSAQASDAITTMKLMGGAALIMFLLVLYAIGGRNL